jgi:hypothetical protein
LSTSDREPHLHRLDTALLPANDALQRVVSIAGLQIAQR